MAFFGVFQASFDGGLRPQQHRKGRLAAFALKSAAVVLAGGSLLAILHVKSDQLSDLANADVRPPAIVMSQDEPCAQQSWPFIEGRCLIDTESLKRSERESRQALAAKDKSASQGLASRKKRARAKSIDGMTVATTRSRSTTQAAVSTTGASPRNEETSAAVKVTSVANAPAPETPSVATPPAVTPVASATPPKTDNAITLRRAQDQQHREAQRRVRLTREQREARAEARRDEQRSASRWDGNPYSSSYSGGLQRGPFDNGFFSTIR